MNIVNDLVDSIVDGDQKQPFNSGVLIVFYVSTISLIVVWMGMLWLLLGSELQSYAMLILGLTLLLIASVSWFVYEMSRNVQANDDGLNQNVDQQKLDQSMREKEE